MSMNIYRTVYFCVLLTARNGGSITPLPRMNPLSSKISTGTVQVRFERCTIRLDWQSVGPTALVGRHQVRSNLFSRRVHIMSHGKILNFGADRWPATEE